MHLKKKKENVALSAVDDEVSTISRSSRKILLELFSSSYILHCDYFYIIQGGMEHMHVLGLLSCTGLIWNGGLESGSFAFMLWTCRACGDLFWKRILKRSLVAVAQRLLYHMVEDYGFQITVGRQVHFFHGMTCLIAL
ncbi:unnamed protein product [Prunus armeniaca]|uniref:Uncharacterized protein n=1 Tax=Prunus armeniaca TaxID=36596 RepID=A0A6J5W363_PRUAR|nr:unnamed protein product [Prunus armeniaca]